MYITEVLTKTKKGEVSHRCILLRESYRERGKVKNRTIANLTHSNAEELAAMRLALAHKDDLSVLKSIDDVELEQGRSIGAAWLVYEVAVGDNREGAKNNKDGSLYVDMRMQYCMGATIIQSEWSPWRLEILGKSVF
jgi:hypothetical protein